MGDMCNFPEQNLPQMVLLILLHSFLCIYDRTAVFPKWTLLLPGYMLLERFMV